jgi:hypothetical protein
MNMRQHALLALLMFIMILPIGAQEKIEAGKDVEVYALTPGMPRTWEIPLKPTWPPGPPRWQG